MAPPPTSLLPSNHFLSLPPSFTASLSSPSSSSAAPNTTTLASADFEVDVRTGFLPGEAGLSQLPVEYMVWERLVEEAKEGFGEGSLGVGMGGEEWRERVREVSQDLYLQRGRGGYKVEWDDVRSEGS